MPLTLSFGAQLRDLAMQDSMPASGQAALGLMIVWCVLSLFGYWFYLGRHRRVPAVGSVPAGTRNYNVGWRHWMPLVGGLVIFILKLSALSVDQWSINDQAQTSTTYTYGVTGIRFHSSRPGVQNEFTSYQSLCEQLAGFSPGDEKMCHVLRASGALILAAGILGMVCTSVFLILALVSRRGPEAFANKGVRMWRLCGVAYLTSLTCYSMWCLGGLLIVSYWDDGDSLGASWWLMLTVLILEQFMATFIRRAVMHAGGGGVLPPQYVGAAYAVMPVAYVVGQPQPQPGYAPPQPAFNPAALQQQYAQGAAAYQQQPQQPYQYQGQPQQLQQPGGYQQSYEGQPQPQYAPPQGYQPPVAYQGHQQGAPYQPVQPQY